jgi:hypothetical protein
MYAPQDKSINHPITYIIAALSNNQKRNLIAQKDNSFGLSQPRDGRGNLIIV